MPIDGLDDVPRARRFAAERLRPAVGGDLVDAAQLVTTELVTNALLHGHRPVSLRVVGPTGGSVLVEVADSNPMLPEQSIGGEDEMTGRGLALIDALAERWGAEEVSGGKVVWCELRETTDGDGTARADAPSGAAREAEPLPARSVRGAQAEASRPSPVPVQGTSGEAERLLTLPDVPVGLLLATEAHVDDLVRDLTLASAPMLPWRDDAVPSAVAERVARAADGIDVVRRSLRRQALDARAAGAEEFPLKLPVGLEIQQREADFLAALDEADAYCRAARLLTLEAPPQQRVLRSWVADQITAASTPGETPAVQSFRERLLAELAHLAAAQRSAERATRLHRVATGLSEARTPEEVSGVVLAEGSAALGAARAGVFLLEGADLRLVGALGLEPVALARTSQVRRDDHLPSAEAIRIREPVWVESLTERDRRYPELAETDPTSHAAVAAPLLIGDRVLGVLRFGFDSDLIVDDDERSFVVALAAQTASALDRALVYAAEHAARRAAELTANRLARLQEVTSRLNGTADESEVAEVVLGHAVEALGCRVGALCLLPRPMTRATLSDDVELRITHMVGVTDAARERWGRFRVGDPLPAGEAVRSNVPVVLPTVADRKRRFPALRENLPVEEHALVVLPLSVGERRIGALTLSFFEEPEQPGEAGRSASVFGDLVAGGHGKGEQRFFGEDDLAFVSSLAAACASALDRADAVRQLRSASNRLAFLAEASVELSSSLDYARTLARVAELAVPVLADWCSVATLAGEDLETLAVAHIQPEKVALAWEIQRRYPPNPDTAAAHRVLRSGQAEMYTGITDEQVEASAVNDEHRRMLREMGPLRALMLVPMTARGRTLGVLTLLSAERDFEPSDLALAEDLGRRAALAVDNAALFRDASEQRDR